MSHNRFIGFCLSAILHGVVILVLLQHVLSTPLQTTPLTKVEVTLDSIPKQIIIHKSQIRPSKTPPPPQSIPTQGPEIPAKPAPSSAQTPTPTPQIQENPPPIPEPPASPNLPVPPVLASPDYDQNAPPDYPEEALASGKQGTTILFVSVSSEGKPTQIFLKKSSGHRSLDKAAMGAAQHWVFLPAKVGNIPTESVVEVPVRFEF